MVAALMPNHCGRAARLMFNVSAPARNRSDTVGEIGSLVRGHCVGWLSCPEVAHVASPAAAGPTCARRHRPYCPRRVPTGQSVCATAQPARPRVRRRGFADLYPRRGQPAYTPWRLALVTLLQFREGLSDRQAAEAVRARIDWKYLLALDLADAGFDHTVLCEFRARLLAGDASERLLARVLDTARDAGLLKARGRQRTDSTHVLAAVRDLNRIELLAETLRAALNAIAGVAPEPLRVSR